MSSEGNELIDELLELPKPQLSPELCAYLEEPMAIEHLICKITLKSGGINQMKERLRGSNDQLRIGLKATELLLLVNVESRSMFIKLEERIIHSLMEIFQHDSAGSFHHFRKLFLSILIRCPNALSIMIDKGYIMIMLNLYSFSPVQDSLVSFFVTLTDLKNSIKSTDIDQQKLCNLQFFNVLFEVLLDWKQPEKVTDAYSILKRILSSASKGKLELIVFRPLVENNLLELMFKMLKTSTNQYVNGLYIDIAHSILSSIGDTLKNARSCLIKVVAEMFEQDNLMVQRLERSKLVILIRVWTLVVQNSEKEKNLSIPWCSLINSYYDSKSSIYMYAFSALFCASLTSPDLYELLIVFDMLISDSNRRNESYPFSLMMLESYMNSGLKVQEVESHSHWHGIRCTIEERRLQISAAIVNRAAIGLGAVVRTEEEVEMVDINSESFEEVV